MNHRQPHDPRRSNRCASALLLLVAGCAADASADPAGGVGQRISSSPTHSCALRKAGLYCWGESFAGQLGRGDLVDSDAPVHASVAGTDVVEFAVATGRTCVRRSTGELACWGINDRGQIGDGTREGAMTPVAARGIDDAAQFAIDDYSSCVLRGRDASVACWGNSPESAPQEGFLTPTRIEGLTDIVEVRAGVLGSYCARDKVGKVSCWRFIDGKWTDPSEVTELAGARALALSWADEVCAISKTREVVCHNLASGVTDTMPSSKDSERITASGGIIACAMNSARSWRCWNVIPSTISLSFEVRSTVPVVDLSVPGLRGCAVFDDDSVGCYDANQLTAPLADALPPFVPVAGLPL
jgi:hypothetical protein